MEFVANEKNEEDGKEKSTSTTLDKKDETSTLTPGEQQRLIRQVQANSSLSREEKQAALREILQKKVQHTREEKEKCTHYDKKCSDFFFECCQTYDACHRCHERYNECKKRDISKITCLDCHTEQGVSNECINCRTKFSNSFCGICKIWTHATEIFHCSGCGICRVGRREDYRHCDQCNGCFLTSASHTCLRKPLDELECLVCMESAHSTQDNTHMLDCGHVMHARCFEQYLDSNQYKCPSCRKSIIDMTMNWEILNQQIINQPMPEAYKKDISILCNDCGKQCVSAFHFLGTQCTHCGSYNTS